ncbi:MAG: hypothetical protein ABEJ68_10785 [Halobacteriaceae archaeon]
MVEFVTALRLAGHAIGAFGGLLVFLEFFQLPSYVEYDENFGTYDLSVTFNEVVEHTWLGRLGALCIALAFTLQFLAVFLA